MSTNYVFINSPTIAEGNSGTKIMTFVVQRGGGTDAFDVDFTTMDGIARAADGDYVATSGTLHFDAGVVTRTISVVINGDTKTELNEDFAVQLSNPSNGVILESSYGSGLLNTGLGIGNILNDENLSGAGLVWISDVPIVEGDGGNRTIAFAVQRTGGTEAFQLNYTTVDRGATSNGWPPESNDYVPTSGTLQFAPGETLKYIIVPIRSDLQFEPTESFWVQLSDASGGAILGQGQGYAPSFMNFTSFDVGALGTIVNDDAGSQSGGHMVSIAFGNWIAEGNSGTNTLIFTVTRSGGTAAFDVDYRTIPGSATAGEDFTSKSGTLHFAKDQMTATISIKVKGDTVSEPDENFLVEISNATNGVSIGPNTANTAMTTAGIIGNDDGYGAGVVWIDNAVVEEGDSGSRTLTFTVNRTGGTDPFSIDYRSSGNFGANGATEGSDFDAKSGTLVFAEGQTSRTITIRVKGDTAVEGNETLSVYLGTASRPVTIVQGSATGIILNDDGLTGPGNVWVEDTSIAEGNGGARIMTFTVFRAGGTSAFDVSYSTADYYGKSAVAGDFVNTSGVLHFGSGVMSKTVKVTVYGDREHLPGGAGSLALILSNATDGAVIARGIALGHIVDDDPLSAADDVNDAPVIGSNGGGATASVSVVENATAVTTVQASDADAGTTPTYSLAGGTDAALFAINATTGVLTFKSTPNFEAPADAGANNVYDVIVQASDGTLTDTQAIAVTVTNVNEAPVIGSNGGGITASISVAENVKAVTKVKASDADAGAKLTYSLAGGADAALFAINARTGALTFKSAPNFEVPADAGVNNVYDVIVQASDGTLTDTQAIAVTVTDVNEAAPVIGSNGGGATASISVAENAKAVTTVQASDADAGATLTYSLAGGTDAALFAINATTGVLTFKSAPNFEVPADAGANNVYDVIVQASDGTLIDTQAIAVTVTDVNEAPVIGSNGGGATASISVAENAKAVTTVQASGADAGAKLTYSLAGGADAALFAINATTGVLTFKSAPNFEAPADAGANNVYDVIVQASDGTLTDTQAIAVTVTNVNEAPVIGSNGGKATASISVAENAKAVTTVQASDADAGAKLTYSLAGGADAALFAINARTGVLTFKSAPNFEAPADAGANNVYDVIVQASDGTLTDTQTLAVTVTDVNEAAPVIGSNGGKATASISVAENVKAVTTVQASDADAGATFTYSLAGGTDAALFAINARTGALAFKSAPNFEAPADAGADNVYDVIVQASDGTLTDTQAIAVTVTNVNEAPVIGSNGGGATASISVAENVKAVTTVQVNDADAGATLTYSLAGGADAALFAINATTGALTFKSKRDFEAPADAGANNVYDVIVQVSDGTLTDTQAIAVTVTDVNEATPVIGSNGGGAIASVSVAENAKAVTTAQASDVDAGATLTWSLSGGADKALFAIDATTGVLTFKSAPDFEAPTDKGKDNVYDVTIKVSDGTRSDKQALAVTVTDVNESPDVDPAPSGKLVIFAFEGEPWVTDGTTAGTFLLKDVHLESYPFAPRYIMALGGDRAVFQANEDGDTKLWVTDGTVAGTIPLEDIALGPDFEFSFIALGDDRVVFNANDGIHGYEPWVTDGTAEGTFLLKDIDLGIGYFPLLYMALGDGRAVFRAADDIHGSELWVTDGTAEGTFLIEDINFGSSSFPTVLTSLGDGRVIFSANDGNSGYEPWVTDGTAEGTFLLKDINPWVNGSDVFFSTGLGDGRAVFWANDGSHGHEPWVTDGTEEGTFLLGDIRAGGRGSNPGGSNPETAVTLGDGRMLFWADDGIHGSEPWMTDGTTAGTFLLKDMNPGSDSSSHYSFGLDFTELGGGQWVFSVDDDVHGDELWVTDGTTAGTHLLKDINAGSNPSSPSDAFALEDVRMIFSAADGHDRGLWITDGTTAGTRLLKDTDSPHSPRSFIALGDGKVVFAADGDLNTHYGYDPWVTDGTAAGTFQLRDVNLGAGPTYSESFYVDSFTALGDGRAMFMVSHGDDYGLWITDGTEAGTSFVMAVDRWSALADSVVISDSANGDSLATVLGGAPSLGWHLV